MTAILQPLEISRNFFPCKYLGMPLSLQQLRKENYQALLDKVDAILGGGYPFRLTGANEPIIEKTYFKMSKNLEQKFYMYILTCYVCTQIFRRKEHFLCPI
jgi:hypothetical protein